MLDKDDYLEELFGAENADPERRRELSRRADELLLGDIGRHRSAVVVSFWRRVELSATSGTPVDRLPSAGELVEVWCDCRPEIALDRFFARRRHPAHGDEHRDRAATLKDFRRLAMLGPLGAGRLVRVDTNGELDIDDVLTRLPAS